MWDGHRWLRKGRVLVNLFHIKSGALELRLGEHTRLNRLFVYHGLRDTNQMKDIAAHLLKILIRLSGEFDHAPVVPVNRNVVMPGLAWHSFGSRSFKHHDGRFVCKF